MHESITKYHSYLIRLWQEGEHAVWHASAQCVQSRDMVHFADLDDLVTFLWAQTAPAPHTNGTRILPEEEK